MNTYHTPALLKPSIEGLNINPDGVYIDLTYGGGGHSKAILERLNNGKLIVFDQDKDAWENRIDDERMIFVRHNFRYVYNFLSYIEAIPVDGIIADLGVSSHHFDVSERGFSFRTNGNLDMRMNQNAAVTAETVVNTYNEEQLVSIFKMYGEISSAGRLAREIISCRSMRRIATTGELKEIAAKFAPPRDSARYLSQVFQSLRIEVNNEMDALKEMLSASIKVLNKGGRLVIISYHSLEDRLVKNFFRTGDVNKSEPETDIYGKSDVPFKVITRKVIVPEQEEIEMNPRSRSAKLRIAEKI